MSKFHENIADAVRLQVFDDVVRANASTHGNVFWVVEDSDTDYNALVARYGSTNVFTTLTDAYNAVTTNRNDIIFLHGQSSHTLDEGLTWSKNRVHVIGLDGGDRLVQQGSKVQTPSDADEAFVLKVTGVRNSFRNIKFIQNSTNAAALTVVQMGGEGNLYKNCSFTFGVVDNLDQTDAYEVINGEDSGTFIDCQFGVDTLLTSAARSVMRIDQVTSGQEFKSNRFRGCNFLISSSSATAEFITLAAAGDILFTNLFEDCTFTASLDSAGGSTLTRAVSSPNGTTKGTLYFRNPVCFGVSNFGVNGTNNDNIQAYGAANTGTDYHGIAPIAT